MGALKVLYSQIKPFLKFSIDSNVILERDVNDKFLIVTKLKTISYFHTMTLQNIDNHGSTQIPAWFLNSE